MLNFDFSEEYILEDDFARLTPLRMDHAELLLNIATEKAIWKYSIGKGDFSRNCVEEKFNF